MKIIKAIDHGVIPNTDVTKQLSQLFKFLKTVDDEKTLVFESGKYFIKREKCDYEYYAITNTVGKNEYSNKQEINMHYIALHIQGINDLIIHGNGAEFIVDGKVTNCVISSCKNITIKDISIDTILPNIHKFTVKKKGLFSVDFELDDADKYVKNGNGFEWNGNGYRLGFTESANTASWIASIKPSNPNRVFRTNHPFRGCLKVKEKSPHKFTMKYLVPFKTKIGQRFYIFDTMRSDVGIFVSGSENVSVINIAQYFNYSLAYVAQDCCNLKIEKAHFAPKTGSSMEIISVADFIQICMCSGDVVIKDCLFDGAADDALNVHGIHFKISKIAENNVTVKFCHKQSWGFNPLHAGDKIEFIDPKTMLSIGENEIINSKLVDDYHIELTLKNKNIPCSVGGIIEDVTRCPNVFFSNNCINRIITRGLLLTTRGKVVIENNHFKSNHMSGILLSDDARNWYESGMCKDVVIQNNVFDDCGGTPILIKPENLSHNGAVHTNIKILNNKFNSYDTKKCISIKSSSNIEIKSNKFSKPNPLKVSNCDEIKKDF